MFNSNLCVPIFSFFFLVRYCLFLNLNFLVESVFSVFLLDRCSAFFFFFDRYIVFSFFLDRFLDQKPVFLFLTFLFSLINSHLS